MDNTPDNAQSSESDAPLHLEAYRQMLASLFIATLVVIVLMLVVSLVIHYSGDADPPILLGVAMFGAVGALFSALLRLYTLSELPEALINPDLRALRNKYLLMYSFTPIIIGFVSAVVVYISIMGGYLSSPIFPAFQCNAGDGQCDSFVGFFNYGPAEAKDYAKALILGFVSGFSERLVRDVVSAAGNVEKK